MPQTDTPAFLAGSRAYGTPRPDSDVDLVVFMPVVPFALMSRAERDHFADRHESAHKDASASLRFGGLNLIIHTDKKVYNAWRGATEHLWVESPVSRYRAVEVIKYYVSQKDVLDTPAFVRPSEFQRSAVLRQRLLGGKGTGNQESYPAGDGSYTLGLEGHWGP